ncbi:MAG: DNA polymerase III subunit gamma/tau [Patescibacteria group bacterium]
MVFYLKYRPKKISELDNLFLREKLESVLRGKLPDKIPHAFLFTGPKGLGKTSTARILAKTINCTKRKANEIEPCNACSSCKSINNGSNLDVLEIDAASNRGIDEIRDLREKIRLSPLSSLKKVYIIDEVHMLTAEAFNALLKTLEEPPVHAIFILCTTEPQKIPGTITSRCFQIKFSRATDTDLVSSFQRIVKGEGIKADKEALLTIAKLSDGSFRDGVKILEELSTHSSNITANLIERNYKTESVNKYVTDLISAFAKKDAGEGIKIVDRAAKEGVDFKLLSEDLIDMLHQGLIFQVNGEKFDLSLEQTKNLIKLLVKSHQSIKYALLPQLPIELTIVEWAAVNESRIMNQELSQVSSLHDTKSERIVPVKKPSIGVSENDKILLDLINRIKRENFSIAGVLRGCKVEKFDKKELILSTSYKFHKERLKDKKISELIEVKLKEITGEKTKFSVI